MAIGNDLLDEIDTIILAIWGELLTLTKKKKKMM